MSGRGGFALITVLWLILLLGALTSGGIAPIVLDQRASENRVALTRARWAALGCLDLVRARAASRSRLAVDSIALGETVWCETTPLNADERVNPNVADSAGLLRLLESPTMVASFLDWIDEDDVARAAGAESEWYRGALRPLPRNAPLYDPAELALVRGFEALTPDELERVFTTRGSGRISPNRAPRWALGSISVLSADQIERLMIARDRQTSFVAAEQVTAAIGLEPTIPEFRELTQRLSFNESERTVVASGRVSLGTRTIESEIVAVLTQTDDELVVTHLVVR